MPCFGDFLALLPFVVPVLIRLVPVRVVQTQGGFLVHVRQPFDRQFFDAVLRPCRIDQGIVHIIEGGITLFETALLVQYRALLELHVIRFRLLDFHGLCLQSSL